MYHSRLRFISQIFRYVGKPRTHGLTPIKSGLTVGALWLRGKPHNLFSHWPLIIILFISFTLRFYKIHHWLFFGMDQEYEAFIIKNILSFRHFPLIGVNASDTGLYLGPAFMYLATIPYLIFQGNPLGGAVFASLLGVMTTFMIYKLGTEWFSRKVGLLASFLWAISYVSILYDRQFWNPSPISFLTLIILFSLTKIQQGKNKYFVSLALSLGLALQSHLQAVIFLPIVFLYLYKFRSNYANKSLLTFLAILLAFQLPLIWFEFKHNFINTRALLSIFSRISTSSDPLKSSISDRLNIFLQMLGRTVYINTPVDLYLENGQCGELIPYVGKSNPLIILLLLSSLSFCLYKSFVDKNRQFKDNKLIVFVSTGVLFSILFYNRPIFEYYFLFYLPILFIAFSYTFIFIGQKKLRTAVLFLILLISISNLRTVSQAAMSFSFKDKLAAIDFAQKYVDKDDFNLEAFGGCSRFGGYRYLFEYFGKKPGTSYMDPYFSWLYGETISRRYPRKIILSVVDERESRNSLKWQKEEENEYLKMIAKAQFGKIRVLVIDNFKNE